ncbi:MAG TPA: hypothetical protein VFB16_08775 [Bauldia sp.]|nr:hypothetical protein [Bauldia sp.]
MRRTVATLFLALFAFPAFAGSASVKLAGARVEYDPAVWRVAGAEETAALVFTCIAADCDNEPTLFASARPIATLAEEDGCTGAAAYREPVGIPVPSAPDRIAFSAWSVWSGCRALDAPVLIACGLHKGIAYGFSSTLVSGCNRSPDLPPARLVELLSAVRPIAPE